jgi:hypothetical protein
LQGVFRQNGDSKGFGKSEGVGGTPKKRVRIAANRAAATRFNGSYPKIISGGNPRRASTLPHFYRH